MSWQQQQSLMLARLWFYFRNSNVDTRCDWQASSGAAFHPNWTNTGTTAQQHIHNTTGKYGIFTEFPAELERLLFHLNSVFCDFTCKRLSSTFCRGFPLNTHGWGMETFTNPSDWSRVKWADLHPPHPLEQRQYRQCNAAAGHMCLPHI